tara:strand:- start:986 stop:1288 length:303 start_codon:yes stop_codon:yes gene_type:complete
MEQNEFYRILRPGIEDLAEDHPTKRAMRGIYNMFNRDDITEEEVSAYGSVLFLGIMAGYQSGCDDTIADFKEKDLLWSGRHEVRVKVELRKRLRTAGYDI